ncbi:MAG: adenosylmethionine decarboxylase [Methylococcales symbiont of Hymedesmia sp. n. MRB-2018]|nr:MAG: adenosylmethionine decarboxylase [Methylococcales symbiont of Hymedesmia sp. n. MRB-2018]
MDKKIVSPWGTHLIIDLHQASYLNDIALMKTAIYDVINKTNSTLLFENFHHFQPSGITGIACLVESHISVHTWPDHGFAAFDIFMCGNAQPELAIPLLKHYFGGTEKVTTLHRGQLL